MLLSAAAPGGSRTADPKPKLRYPAGPTARRVSVLSRIAPARTFDKSIRKLDRMPI